MKPWRGILTEYQRLLTPAIGRLKVPPVTLLEGNTPLLPARRLPARLDLRADLYLKVEGANPTGSFKDRGMTVAVTKAVEAGSRAILCASTGNTAASAAAYAARAGLDCFILIPEGSIAKGKLAQAVMHGARVIAIRGNFDAALALARAICDRYPVTLVNSVNPYRLEGQKTAAFEICRQLGGPAPDYLVLPVGNAGNITAYWKGFSQYHSLGLIAQRPRMVGFQARGADPIVRGRVISSPKTLATAIRIGNPASWQRAVEARQASQGLIASVTDSQILKAYQWLAETEGVFAEPSSCASLAGLIHQAGRGYFKEGSRIVCVLTGHGLKDQDTALAVAKPFVITSAQLEDVVKACGLKRRNGRMKG